MIAVPPPPTDMFYQQQQQHFPNDFRQLLLRLTEKVDVLNDKVYFIFSNYKSKTHIKHFSSIRKIPRHIQTWKQVFLFQIFNELLKYIF